VTNANGTVDDSSSSSRYEFVLTGDSVIDYDLAVEESDTDESALIAALDYATKFSSDDYSSKSYSVLDNALNNYSSYVAAGYNQYDIDNATSAILTAISGLVPYLNISVSATNGSAYYSYIDYEDNVSMDNVTADSSICFGSKVTAVATANEGYEFLGWYEITTSRRVSTDLTYTFLLSSNTSIQAKFKSNDSATLTFSNSSGWISKQVTKTADEWAELTTISDLLPDVPYKLGYTNGSWKYDDATVLSALQSGDDVTVYPVYDLADGVNYQIPTVDDTPIGELYYKFDSDNKVLSFTMALGVPTDLDVQEIGMAFYCASAETFDPNDCVVTMNNRTFITKFSGYTTSGIYIYDALGVSGKYNYAAVGYVTYLQDGELKIAYSNQVNVAF
jgi:hypothetical protein